MPEREEVIVAEYEVLAEMYLGVIDSGSDWSTRQSLADAATSMQALCAEVRRLQAGIQAVRSEVAERSATPQSIIDALNMALMHKTEGTA